MAAVIPRCNVLETLNDAELLKRYHFNCKGILIVMELVKDAITSPTNRNNPISAKMKCLARLCDLATRKMQLCNTNDLGLSQPFISQAIHQTTNVLRRPHIIEQFIYLPLDIHHLQRNKVSFRAIARLPGVIGAIDGMYVLHEDVFVNRKQKSHRQHTAQMNHHTYENCTAFESHTSSITII